MGESLVRRKPKLLRLPSLSSFVVASRKKKCTIWNIFSRRPGDRSPKSDLWFSSPIQIPRPINYHRLQIRPRNDSGKGRNNFIVSPPSSHHQCMPPSTRRRGIFVIVSLLTLRNSPILGPFWFTELLSIRGRSRLYVSLVCDSLLSLIFLLLLLCGDLLRRYFSDCCCMRITQMLFNWWCDGNLKESLAQYTKYIANRRHRTKGNPLTVASRPLYPLSVDPSILMTGHQDSLRDQHHLRSVI